MDCIGIIQYINSFFGMQSDDERKEKVKLISLYDHKRNHEDKFILSLKLLGQGKCGKVYKATHADKPDLIFAVKVVQLSSQKIRKECLKELEIVKHLPPSLNLVKIHQQHLESENNLYIFEEYCEGGNMAELKTNRNGKDYAEEEIFDIFFQLISGFMELRKAGIFHEDIKPQNILKKNNLYKFTDFGISQLSGNYETSIVRKGTLSYMPPEKLKPTEYIPTSKSQIFSLGITLYEIIFGSHPYLKKRVSDYKIYLKQLNSTKLKSVDELKASYPEASLRFDKLIRIILRMIDLREGKRLSLDELEDYLTSTEPFKSMKVAETFENKQEHMVPKKYDIISHSKVFVKDENGLTGSMKFSINNSAVDHEVMKLYVKFVRQASSYLLQGISYSKRSNIFELKKNISKREFYMNQPIKRMEYLEFVMNFFNDYGFGELAKKYNELLYSISQQEESIYAIDNDVEFIKNQFLKVFMDSSIGCKKELREFLKLKEIDAVYQICEIVDETFSEINCVRVNFKEDLLTTLFLKNVSTVIMSLKTVLDSAMKGSFQAQKITSAEVVKAQGFIQQFNQAEIEKRPQLATQLEEIMKDAGHEMLYDIESNSDEFEVLELDD